MPKTSVEIETFHWKGQLRYKCPLKWSTGAPCQYDTYDVELLKKHMVSDHTRPNGLEVPVTPQSLADQPTQDFNKTPDPEFEFVKFKEI
jgi:hypothetical protein